MDQEGLADEEVSHKHTVQGTEAVFSRSYRFLDLLEQSCLFPLSDQ